MPSPLICIPPNDVFKYDLLGLEPAIASRTEALLSRSPQAVAIDGRWGAGKSTFMALWAAYLRHQGVKVVQFNAWKAFNADPFCALTSAILSQIEVTGSKRTPFHKKLRAFLACNAPKLSRSVKLVSFLQPELEPIPQIVTSGIEAASNILTPEPEDRSDVRIDSPDEFASLLSSAAMEWSDRPVVIMIDELDRCSPEYSVDMLQLLEHVFHTEGVVFVVALNQSELIHSIGSFYGEKFDAEGYLERFFDEILPLPTSNRPQYIRTSLSHFPPNATSSVLLFFEPSRLSLREIDKSIQNLKSALQISNEAGFTTVQLWTARTIAPVEYRQFILGRTSDKMLSDAVFTKGNCGHLRASEQRDGSTAQLFEATLIATSCILPLGSALSRYSTPATKSDLYRHYKSICDNEEADDVSLRYSRGVLKHADEFSMDLSIWRMAVRLLDREGTPH